MKKLLPTLAAFLLVSFIPATAFAVDCGQGTNGLLNPTKYCNLNDFLAGILHAVVLIVFPIIVLFLVYIGWLFVFNGDKPEELKKAREYLLWAVIGALIVLGAEALSHAIAATVHAISGN